MDSNMYCDTLKQKMMPSLQKLSSNITTTSNTPTEMTTTLLLKVKVIEWPSVYPDLNPIEHMWGILKQKVEKHHVSNNQKIRDVVMEEWKRMPATTGAVLVNSMPRRIKAVLDNNGALQNIDTVLTCSLIFGASYLDNNGFMWSYI